MKLTSEHAIHQIKQYADFIKDDSAYTHIDDLCDELINTAQTLSDELADLASTEPRMDQFRQTARDV